MEERKKKHKKASIEEDINFHGREDIKFGDVVQAPPKLSAIPKVFFCNKFSTISYMYPLHIHLLIFLCGLMKAFKITHDASQERIRLQAIEAYRKRKGWASRPGVQLPPPVTTEPLV